MPETNGNSMVATLAPQADARQVITELTRRGASTRLLGDGNQRMLLVQPAMDVSDVRGVTATLIEPSSHPRVDAAASTVAVGPALIGDDSTCLIAGPCAVESEEQIQTVAAAATRAGATLLRGGAFKPRTSPYHFSGLGLEGLKLLRDAARDHGMAAVSEALASEHVELVADHVDMLQVGSRTMAAYGLLREIGRTGKPVLLKRGMAATADEWLLAAEHLLEAGASGVVLCERGIRTFDQPTRNTLDLGTVAWLRTHCPLPIVVDPSHATGRRDLVLPMARAAVAAGAHGVMVEVHPDPGQARSDALQALTLDQLEQLGQQIESLSAWSLERVT